MAGDISARLADELGLLEAMYPGPEPEQIRFDRASREVTFLCSCSTAFLGDGPGARGSGRARANARLVLRLPERYPDEGSPDVVLASACDGRDLRDQVMAFVGDACAEGVGEVLDVLLLRFMELVQTQGAGEKVAEEGGGSRAEEVAPGGVKTVIIWLHHLLATSKRKLAISPSASRGEVRGITKPGYPGVMVFSGDKAAVELHVAELKALNWQAFAIRYEAEESWRLGGDRDVVGVSEVETMAEVVQCIEQGRREEFLRAVGVK